MPNLDDVLAGYAQQTPAQEAPAETLSGPISPFITSLIAGAPKWLAEQIEGTAPFLPPSFEDNIKGAANAVRGVVPAETSEKINATMSQKWFGKDSLLENLVDGWHKAEAIIGDQLPMWGISAGEGALAKAAMKLAKIPNPYAKGLGALVGMGAMAFMISGPERRKYDEYKGADGTPIDDDISNKYSNLASLGQSVLEYSELFGAKALFAGARVGGMDKAAAKGLVSKLEEFAGHKILAYPQQIAEEIGQGYTGNIFMDKAIDAMRERHPDWKPAPVNEQKYGKDDAIEDAVAAGLITGFFHGSGVASRIVTGRVDENQERANATVAKYAETMTNMRAPDGSFMRVIHQSGIEDISKKMFEADQAAPGGGWFKRGTVSSMITDLKNQAAKGAGDLTEKANSGKLTTDEAIEDANAMMSGYDALSRFELAEHNTIYRERGVKAAADYLAQIFKIPVVNDKATVKQTFEEMMEYYTGDAAKGQLIRREDPDTGRVFMVPVEKTGEVTPFRNSDKAAVFGHGVQAEWSDIEQSLRETSGGGHGKYHIAFTRGEVNNPDLLSKITGIKSTEQLGFMRAKLNAALDFNKATFGNEGKLLYSFAQYAHMTKEQARDSGKAEKEVITRLSANNTVVDVKGQLVPVLSLYHGFRNVGVVEDFGELVSSIGTYQKIASDPVKAEAWRGIDAIKHDFNSNFLSTARAYLKENGIVELDNMATPAARQAFLSKSILETATKLKEGNGLTSKVRTNRAVSMLVGVDGNQGILSKVRTMKEMTQPQMKSIWRDLNTIRREAGLMTTAETIQSLIEMDPIDSTRDTPGKRERFWKAVTLNMWGQDVFANQSEAKKYALLAISPEKMVAINKHFRTLVGDKVFETMVENPNGNRGEKFDLNLIDKTSRPGEKEFILTEPAPKSEIQVLKDQIADLMAGRVPPPVAPVAGPVASQAPSNPVGQDNIAPPPVTPVVTPPSPPAPVVTPVTGGIPKQGRKKRVKKQESTPSPSVPAQPITPENTGKQETPPVPEAGRALNRPEALRLVNLGWTAAEIQDMDPALARARLVRGLKKVGTRPIGFDDVVIETQKNDWFGTSINVESTETFMGSRGDVNSQSAAQVLAAMLSQQSIVGRFASLITADHRKALPTKIGEDYLYEAARNPKSIIFRVLSEPDTLAKLKDKTVKNDYFVTPDTLDDDNIIPTMRDLLQRDVISVNQLRMVAKYFKEIRKSPVLYGFVSMGEDISSPVVRLQPQNKKQVVERWMNVVANNGPDALMAELESFNGSAKQLSAHIRSDILDKNNNIIPARAAKWLERLTLIPEQVWFDSYINGQNHVTTFNTAQQDIIAKSRGEYKAEKAFSATTAALKNLFYQLSRTKNEVITHDIADKIMHDAIINDGSRIDKDGNKQSVPSPLSNLSAEARDFRSLSGSYVSVTGDQGQAMTLRTQAIDSIEELLRESGMELDGNVIVLDGLSVTQKYGGRTYVDADKQWDDALPADRMALSRVMFNLGFIEVGQMGDKTRGVFVRMNHDEFSPEDTLYVRDAIGAKDGKSADIIYKEVIDKLLPKYQAFYDSLHEQDKIAFKNPADLKTAQRAEGLTLAQTRAYSIAHWLYNGKLIMKMDADTAAMKRGEPGLSSYMIDGVLDIETFGKRRSQAMTPGRALDDGKTINTIVVDEFKSIKDDPILAQAAQAFMEENSIDNIDELFNGISLFMPKFSERYEKEMGSELKDGEVRQDGLFGIKAHYRGDGTLIKVNWINVKKLADMGSPVFQDLYARLKDSDVELIVFKQNGVKTGNLPVTKIWGADGKILPTITGNPIQLRSERFYTPLDMNTDTKADHAKNSKQQEHNALHLKNAPLREGLMAKYIANSLPKWRDMVTELMTASQTRDIPGNVTTFLNDDHSIRYRSENGLWVGYDAKPPKGVISKPIMAGITTQAASPIYLRGIWTDLFGNKTDLIEMTMAGENPFGPFNNHRTIPLLLSKLERVLEIGGERTYAQLVSPGNHQDVEDLLIDGNNIYLPNVVANLKHADGSKLFAKEIHPTLDSAIEKIMADPAAYPWVFNLDDTLTPIRNRENLKVDQLIVNTDEGVKYIIPGEMFAFPRTPADNVPSSPIGMLGQATDVDTAAIMIHTDLAWRMGADLDGDQKGLRMLNKVNGRFVFDDSLPGLENRILMSHFADAQDPEQAHLWMQTIALPYALGKAVEANEDIAYDSKGNLKPEFKYASQLYLYKNTGHKAKAEAAIAGGAQYLNSWSTSSKIREENILSQQTIGVAASMGRFCDFALRFGLFNDIGKQIVKPATQEDAYQFKRLVTAPLISLCVDNPKDPLLRVLNLNTEGVSLFVTKCLLDSRLRAEKYSDKEKAAFIREHLAWLRSDKVKDFTNLLELKRYGLLYNSSYGSSYGLSHLPALLRLKPFKGNPPPFLRHVQNIYDLINDKTGKIEILHEAASAIQQVNRVINLSMRDIAARTVYDATKSMNVAREYVAFADGAVKRAEGQVYLGDGFNKDYLPVVRSVLQAFQKVTEFDVTTSDAFMPLIFNEKGYMVTEEQFGTNMANLKKRIVSEVLNAEGGLFKVTPTWLYEQRELRPVTDEKQLIDFLMVTEAGKIALAPAYRGMLDTDKTLWEKLDQGTKNSLFQYMVDTYGFGQNLSNGTFMSYVSDEYRVELSPKIDAFMDALSTDPGRQATLVGEVLSNIEIDSLPSITEETTIFSRIKAGIKDVFGSKVKLPRTNGYTTKDQVKSDKATRFIGRGSDDSSTAAYAKAWGSKANTGIYSASDTVFVSAEGNRKGRISPDFMELQKAIDAKATVITDVKEDRERSYNSGEREVASYLSKAGYSETSPGTWKATQPIGMNDEVIEQGEAMIDSRIGFNDEVVSPILNDAADIKSIITTLFPPLRKNDIPDSFVTDDEYRYFKDGNSWKKNRSFERVSLGGAEQKVYLSADAAYDALEASLPMKERRLFAPISRDGTEAWTETTERFPGVGLKYTLATRVADTVFQITYSDWGDYGISVYTQSEVPVEVSFDEVKEAWEDVADLNNSTVVNNHEVIAHAIDIWKEKSGISYNPNEAYSRGEGIYHDIGAYNDDGGKLFSNITRVLALQQQAIDRGDRLDWKVNPENQVIVSAYTFPVSLDATKFEKFRRPGYGMRLVVRPSSSDIIWASRADVNSGSVRDGEVQIKSPMNKKLNLIDTKMADAIDKRWREYHNELAVRLKIGNFYIENLPLLSHPKLYKLNADLKRAFIKVHGSLSPAAIDNIISKNPSTVAQEAITPSTPSADMGQVSQPPVEAIGMNDEIVPIVGYTNENESNSLMSPKEHDDLFGTSVYSPFNLRWRYYPDLNIVNILTGDNSPSTDSDLQIKMLDYLQSAHSVESPKVVTGGFDPDAERSKTFERQMMSGKPWSQEIGFYDEVVRSTFNDFPIFSAGSESIRGILVSEHNKMMAFQEQTHKVGDQLRKLAGYNPNLLRIAYFVKDDPERFKDRSAVVMDPWQREVTDEWKDVNKAYWNHKSEINDILHEAKDAFDRVLREHNEMLQELSLDGYIKRIDDYVTHMWVNVGQDAATRDSHLKTFGTKYARNRRVPNVFEGAAMGLTPKRLDIADVLEEYARNVFKSSTQKRMLDLITTVSDGDGNIHVIPIYKGNSIPDTKVMENVLGNLSMANGDEAPPSNRAGWTSLKDKFPKMVQKFQQDNNQYVQMPSPYEEISMFLVHPKSVNVMKNVLNLHSRVFDNKFVQTLEHVNNWSKFMVLQASLFHVISILTGIGGSLGGHHKMLKWDGWRPKFAWNTTDFRQWLKKNPMFETDMVESGLQYGRYLDLDGSVITEDLAKAHAWASHYRLTPAVKAIEGFQAYKRFVDKHLWRNMHAMSKIYLSYTLMNHYQAEALEKNIVVDRKQLMKQVANYVNITGGGMDWNNIAWATPSVRRLMHLALFAPDWTISNLEIGRAGLAGFSGFGWTGNIGIMPKITPLARRESIKRYWPALIVFGFVLPNMLQLMVHAAFRSSLPDDDKDKNWLAFQNEVGKEKDVDITPMIHAMNQTAFFKAFGFKIDQTKMMEHFYASFSKQINEIPDWFKHPVETLMNKSSMIVKIGFEQAVGNTTTGFELPFKKDDVVRGFLSADGKFWDGRLGNVLSKFVPMSIMSTLKGQTPGYIAPIGKGMTTAKTKIELEKVFLAYADPTVWDKIRGVPAYERRLDKLAPEIVKAAERNGVNVMEVATEAISTIKGRYTDMLYRGINSKNDAMTERAAAAIVRLGGGMESVIESFSKKLDRNVGDLPEGSMTATQRFIQKAQQRVMREAQSSR